MISGENIICGRARAGKGSDIVQGKDPTTNTMIGPGFRVASADDVEEAVQGAWEAFLLYRKYSDVDRAGLLDAIAGEIEGLGDEVIQCAMAETGLPEMRLRGELQRTAFQFRLFKKVLLEGRYQDIRIDAALPERKPLPRPDIRSRKISLGPVAVFGASNFPFAFSVAGGDTASALAAGCPVIVKAHPAHPHTSALMGIALVSAIEKVGMPPGIFSLLYGVDNSLGQTLVTDHRIKAVGFTGSRSGGVALMHAAASRPEPIPVYAEMSSINPVYLMPGALFSNSSGIAEGLVNAMMLGAGQFCTSPGVVLAVQGNAFNGFIEKAKTLLSGQSAQTMLTSGIANAFDESIVQISKCAQVVGAGKPKTGTNQCHAHLFYTSADDFMNNEILRKEIFGSSVIFVGCRDFSQMTAVTESFEGQLTASIHATDNDSTTELEVLIDQLERKAGRILMNGFGTGVEVCDAIVHGGPYPATSDGRSTSVGSASIERFLRPVCYQNIPSTLLPAVLR
ncbi:MAG: aldehyde dehydrogenase (NADP(+)) [Lautropia sp.]|nr:aldehyde dehydrogenase (NADP(+)) [Lautropia sp.]